MPSTRLFHTHFPYSALPDSIKNSECKIVYITRNPKDTMVSMWHFFNSVRTPEQGPYPFDKAFESFCDGLYPFGPFFDHVLEYWEVSLKKSDKILFLRYEEIKRDPKGLVKRLASFLGRPFVNEEEVEKVLWRCSLDRLKNLKVNKNGSTAVGSSIVNSESIKHEFLLANRNAKKTLDMVKVSSQSNGTTLAGTKSGTESPALSPTNKGLPLRRSNALWAAAVAGTYHAPSSSVDWKGH
ncbi:hypothetical protein HYC85_000496 [Camellia sinensis]|uniref:Sulfotransferase n=1 Tax=Camellia sinensis TaxID=4442 RepID=A0A7J7I3U2_CAMSI|nr:hypothetical protein HYC85_000496 [Camellia sinensis]